MLSFELLKNNAGILLIGDYLILRDLYDVVSEINDRSPLLQYDGVYDGSPLLQFMYGIRKGYESQRKIIQPPNGFEEVGVLFGTQLIWPQILMCQRILRTSLAYIDHTKQHQALIYALEFVLEEAVQKNFSKNCKEIHQWWSWVDVNDCEIIKQLDSRVRLFCSWSKVERASRLVYLLQSFQRDYASFYRQIKGRSDYKQFPTPSEFVKWANLECPDPRW